MKWSNSEWAMVNREYSQMSKFHKRNQLNFFYSAIGFIILLILLTIRQTYAFCGFYVAKADASLFNKTSQVILVRDGDKTVITMSSDFQGDVKDFAMVVPVPVVLKRDDIRTVNRNIFEILDGYSGPRLVEYWDDNPCERQMLYDISVSKMEMAAPSEVSGSVDLREKYSVKIEAQYTVDEYDILILSAEESSGLEKWLIDNGYKIPSGASAVLHPYISSGLKFFVVKVNMDELKKKGTDFLSPLQISFHSPKFMLPIRLGMVNAKGSQDMIIYAFTKGGRIETTNYRTVKVPTGNNIPEFVQQYFGQFYVDTYRKFRKGEGSANVFLEYAWNVSPNATMKCDPCTGTPPVLQDLMTAGVDWVNQYHGGYDGNVFFTRLHVTYDRKSFPQDLFFQETPNQENFQARYVITHPALGDLDCNAAKQYLSDVHKRRYKELQQLAMLTGWDVSSYTPYVSTFNYFPEGSPVYKQTANPPSDNIDKKNEGMDTTGMVPISDDKAYVKQESFNAPIPDDDENNSKPGNGLLLGSISILILMLFIAEKFKRRTEVKG